MTFFHLEASMDDHNTREKPEARSFEERVFARFDSLDERLMGIEQRTAAFDERLMGIEQHMTAFDERLTGLEQHMTAFDERLMGLEHRMTELENRFDAQRRETQPVWEAVLARLDSIDRRIRILHDDLFRVREGQEELRERVSRLESEAPRV